MGWRGESAALAVLSFDVDAESVVLAEDPRHADNPMLMSHQAYGPEGINFYTRGKVVTSRWPDPATSKVDLGFPQTR